MLMTTAAANGVLVYILGKIWYVLLNFPMFFLSLKNVSSNKMDTFMHTSMISAQHKRND